MPTVKSATRLIVISALLLKRVTNPTATQRPKTISQPRRVPSGSEKNTGVCQGLQHELLICRDEKFIESGRKEKETYRYSRNSQRKRVVLCLERKQKSKRVHFTPSQGCRVISHGKAATPSSAASRLRIHRSESQSRSWLLIHQTMTWFSDLRSDSFYFSTYTVSRNRHVALIKEIARTTDTQINQSPRLFS